MATITLESAFEGNRRLPLDLPNDRGFESNSRGMPPQRSIGLRAETEFRVWVHHDSGVSPADAVELSASGIVLEGIDVKPGQSFVRLEMFLSRESRPVLALARLVRRMGSRKALHFVGMTDADRLTLMEHLDHRIEAPTGTDSIRSARPFPYRPAPEMLGRPRKLGYTDARSP